MRRILTVLFTVLVLSACTPEQQFLLAWLNRPEAVACPEWLGATRLAGFSEAEIPTMHQLMRRESGCRPWAVGPTDDHGLYQIHGSWLPALCAAQIACSRAELLNPQRNAKAARYVFLVQGYAAWSTYHG